MATVSEINQRVATANAEVKRINNERQVNLGKRETLQSQLQTALNKYKTDYGVELTAETLQQEITKVTQEKEAEVAKLEQMLGLINEGKYAEAQQIANPNAPIQTEVPTDAQQTIAQLQPTAQVVEQPQVVTPPQAESTVATPPQAQVATPPVQAAPPQPTVAAPPQAQVTAPPTQVATPPAPPTPSAPKMNLSGIDALANFEPASPQTAPATPPSQPVQPTAPSTPVQPNITSFSAILGGSQFAPM